MLLSPEGQFFTLHLAHEFSSAWSSLFQVVALQLDLLRPAPGVALPQGNEFEVAIRCNHPALHTVAVFLQFVGPQSHILPLDPWVDIQCHPAHETVTRLLNSPDAFVGGWYSLVLRVPRSTIQVSSQVPHQISAPSAGNSDGGDDDGGGGGSEGDGDTIPSATNSTQGGSASSLDQYGRGKSTWSGWSLWLLVGGTALLFLVCTAVILCWWWSGKRQQRPKGVTSTSVTGQQVKMQLAKFCALRTHLATSAASAGASETPISPSNSPLDGGIGVGESPPTEGCQTQPQNAPGRRITIRDALQTLLDTRMGDPVEQAPRQESDLGAPSESEEAPPAVVWGGR